jgi:hypothetical protein
MGTAAADGRARLFWAAFALLDVVAALGLVLFARRYGADSPETRRSAARVMRGVYALIAALGGVFLYVAFSSSPIQPRIAVQSLLFLALGLGGLAMGRRSAPPESS